MLRIAETTRTAITANCPASAAPSIRKNFDHEPPVGGRPAIESAARKTGAAIQERSKTDPDHTKRVSYGKRSFTAIDAYWQILLVPLHGEDGQAPKGLATAAGERDSDAL